MPTYFARKSGNINAADVWATTPSGTASAVTFAAGDVLMANNFAITVNISTNLGSTGQVRNDATSGATAGGGFVLSDGVTLTANVFAGAANCVSITGTVSASVVGNLTGGTGSGRAITHSGSGLLTVTATTIAAGSASDTQGIYAAGSGSTSITCTSLSAGTGSANTPGIRLDSTGSHSFSGNATGGSLAGCHAYQLNAATTATLTGNFTGGSNATAYGALNSVLGTLNIVGQAIGGTAAPGAHNTSTGTISVTRAVGNGFGPGSTGLTAAAGVNNAALGVVEFQEIEFGLRGQPPLTGTGFRLKKANTNVAVFNYADTAGAKTLIDATANAAMPAASDVRSGLSYAGGAATGTLAVPLPSQVAVGVATDNTVGTAFVTGSDIATAVWGAATRTITGGLVDTATTLTNSPDVPTEAEIASAVWGAATKEITGGTVTTLTNAPTVPTPSQIASQVRTELSVELGRVDAAVSSRATAANIPAADITAIKSKTDALPASPAATGDIPTAAQNATAVWSKPANELTVADSIGERAKQQSTVAITGAQLAAALS
jgi:antitoxin (DNA-binding transcriptional repressor) of toxin-antitoxin stability system